MEGLKALTSREVYLGAQRSFWQSLRVDLGSAYGMKGPPVNLLSLSLLADKGAVIHFE